MRRREFIAVLTTIAIGAPPGSASAQTKGLRCTRAALTSVLRAQQSTGRQVLRELRQRGDNWGSYCARLQLFRRS